MSFQSPSRSLELTCTTDETESKKNGYVVLQIPEVLSPCKKACLDSDI